MESESITQTYVTFHLAEELFAIKVFEVQEILEMTSLTKVPESSVFLKGIINLRGNILPVVDTRIKFGMEEANYTSRTRVIVINLKLNNKQPLLLGLIVDAVTDVIELPEDSILPPPEINDLKKAAYVTGIVKREQNFLMILNTTKIFSTDETFQISTLAPEAQVAE